MVMFFDFYISRSLVYFFWNSGSAPIGTEAELEEETEACENSAVDKVLQKPEIQNNEEQNPACALPMTPLRISRFNFWTFCWLMKFTFKLFYLKW